MHTAVVSIHRPVKFREIIDKSKRKKKGNWIEKMKKRKLDKENGSDCFYKETHYNFRYTSNIFFLEKFFIEFC